MLNIRSVFFLLLVAIAAISMALFYLCKDSSSLYCTSAASFSLGVFSSVAASCFLFIILKLLRPKIKISEYIAEYSGTNDKTTLFAIKIINETRTPVYNVRGYLTKISKISAPNGIVSTGESVALIREDPIRLEKYVASSDEGLNAVWFITKENIRCNWDASCQSLQFAVYAVHADSNIGEMSYRTFDHISCIKKGIFKRGNTFDVL